MAWSTPKTDYAGNYSPTPTDFNRIEGNIDYIENDSRTPSQTATPTASGKLSVLLNFIVTQIKKITGGANWYTAPVTTIEALNDGKLNKSGGTMTGILTAQSNTSYTTKQVRNIILSTSDPVLSSMADGDIWIKYK